MNNSFKIKQLPLDYNLGQKDMENEAREHLNLAHYNFNRMAVIDEEGNENNNEKEQSKQGQRKNNNNYLISAGQELRNIKNMHNTTNGFYP